MFGRTFNWKGKAFSPILEKNFPNFKNENPCQGCILSPCLFNLYAKYIMRNARLDEAQAGIKIVGRNINNLRYAGNTTFTFMAESKEKLKSLLMKMKENSEKLA